MLVGWLVSHSNSLSYNHMKLCAYGCSCGRERAQGFLGGRRRNFWGVQKSAKTVNRWYLEFY